MAGQPDGLAAADFFAVEVLTLGGLVRDVVFVVMKLKTRTVEIAGIPRQPDEAWVMAPQAGFEPATLRLTEAPPQIDRAR